jgi:hypothetical protein
MNNPRIEVPINPDRTYSATATGVKMMGTPGTKWYAIALTLKSPSIVKVHKKYIDAGFKHSYPTFQPHLSLKYSPSERDIKLIKESFPNIKKIKLLFSNEELERLKD